MWIFVRHQHLSPESLSGYLDQRLSAGQRARVSRRLAACAGCRQELESWRGTLALLQGLDDVPTPRSFTLAGPPPAPAAAYQPLPLRAPRWVYAGAASVAGLALAVMVSAEAAGILPAPPLETGQAAQSGAAAPEAAMAADSAPALQSAEAPNQADETEGTPAPAAGAPAQAPASEPAPFTLEATPGPEPTPSGDAATAGPPGQPGPAASPESDQRTTMSAAQEEYKVMEDAPTAEPGAVALTPAEGTPLFWRVLQGVLAGLMIFLLGALTLKARRSGSAGQN